MKRQSRRTLIQALAALGQNAYIPGFFRGVIYQGRAKILCVPGLNCYSCPGALGACPIGSLQAAISQGTGRFPAYVLGSLLLFGALLGRLVCGFLCPFGFLQDLLFRIPLPKLRIPRRLDRPLRYLKYLILVLLVGLTLLKLEPVFCKFLCPAGLLEAGIPLTLTNPQFASMRGPLFYVKLAVLVLIVVVTFFVERPFCRYLCPLGAFYGLFNGIGFYRMRVEQSKCVQCGKCSGVCPMTVDPVRTPNSCECIRCGRCIDVCPAKAVCGGFSVSSGKSERKAGNLKQQ